MVKQVASTGRESDRSFVWFLLCSLQNMSFLFQLKTKERKKEECEISNVIWLWVRKGVKTKEKRNANSRKRWLETKEKKREGLKKLKESFKRSFRRKLWEKKCKKSLKKIEEVKKKLLEKFKL